MADVSSDSSLGNSETTVAEKEVEETGTPVVAEVEADKETAENGKEAATAVADEVVTPATENGRETTEKADEEEESKDGEEDEAKNGKTESEAVKRKITAAGDATEETVADETTAATPEKKAKLDDSKELETTNGAEVVA